MSTHFIFCCGVCWATNLRLAGSNKRAFLCTLHSQSVRLAESPWVQWMRRRSGPYTEPGTRGESRCENDDSRGSPSMRGGNLETVSNPLLSLPLSPICLWGPQLVSQPASRTNISRDAIILITVGRMLFSRSVDALYLLNELAVVMKLLSKSSCAMQIVVRRRQRW